MTKADIKYAIELKKYKFELEYQRDFRAIIVANSTLFIIILEFLFRGNISQISRVRIIYGLFLVAILIAVLIVVYINKRTVFFKNINTLFNKYLKERHD